MRRVFREPSGELLALAQLAWWGVILIQPGSTLASGPVYEPMRDLAPELLWAFAFLAIAVAHVASLALVRPGLRRTALVAELGMWGFLSVMIFQGNPAGVGWGQYAILAVFTASLLAVEGRRWSR